MRSPILRTLCVVSLLSFPLVLGCGAQPSSPPGSSPAAVQHVGAPAGSAARDPCASAKALRARVPELLNQGRLDRLVRVIHYADNLCPAQKADSAAALAATEADLANASPDGVALLAAGLQAKREGHTAEAQRLFDRGLYRLEQASGSPPRVVLTAGFDNGIESVAWSSTNWIAVSHGKQVTVLHGTTRQEHLTFDAALVAFSPDGRLLATAEGKSVRFWDVAGGKELGGIEADVGQGFSLDGKRFVGLVQQTRRVWDVATGKPLSELKVPPSAVLSPDWTLGAIAEGRSVRVHDSATGRVIAKLEGAKDEVFSAPTFSRDGTRLVVTGNRQVLWDVAARKTIAKYPFQGVFVFQDFSPDGSVLATTSAIRMGLSGTAPARNAVELRDLRTGKTNGTLFPSEDSGNGITSVAFSPDSRTILTGDDAQTLVFWDRSTAAEGSRIARQSPPIESLALSPDGTRVAASWWNSSRVKSGILSWDLQANRTWQSDRHSGAPTFSPDGKKLVLGDLRNALDKQLLDSASGRELARLEGMQFDFSPDGSKLVVGSEIVDTVSSRPLFALAKSSFRVFSPDGTKLALAMPDRTIDLWDVLAAKKTAVLEGHKDVVLHLAFSADGKSLASGSKDKSLLIWNLSALGQQAAQKIENLPRAPESVALTGEGKVVAAWLPDKTLRLWDVSTRAETAKIDKVSYAHFLPRSGRVVVLSTDDRVRLFDLATGGELAVLSSRGRPTTLASSLDGSTVAAGYDNGQIRLWNASDGSPRITLYLLNAQSGAVFDEHGSVDFVGEGARKLAACRVGRWSVPLEVCEERFVVPSLYAKLAAAERGVLVP